MTGNLEAWFGTTRLVSGFKTRNIIICLINVKPCQGVHFGKIQSSLETGTDPLCTLIVVLGKDAFYTQENPTCMTQRLRQCDVSGVC